jgi:hypothetical protein
MREEAMELRLAPASVQPVNPEDLKIKNETVTIKITEKSSDVKRALCEKVLFQARWEKAAHRREKILTHVSYKLLLQ